MFQKQSGALLLTLFVCVSTSWFEDCPEGRKSLGRCLAGLCPFNAECINDRCCKLDNNLGESLFNTLLKLAGEFPKLPTLKPTESAAVNTTDKPSIATVPLLPPKSSESVEESSKPITSEEIKQALASTTTTTTTTKTPRRSKTKRLPKTTTSTTTTQFPFPAVTEDPLCFDGSYSIGECMDGFCPDGFNCEYGTSLTGYCCKCPNLPCGKKLTTLKPTNILTFKPNSIESNESSSSEESSEEDNSTTTMKPKPKKPRKKKKSKTTTTTITTLTTRPSKVSITNKTDAPIITGATPPTSSTTSSPITTTTISTTTEDDYSTKDVCLEGFPIGECVDNKCPDKHECIQNYCCEITKAINCSDLLRSCKKNLCNKPQYFNFMTEQCGRTCRRCDQQHITGDPRPKRPKRCRDSRNDCEEWAAEGFCKSALYSLEQKRHLCGKSCKLC